MLTRVKAGRPWSPHRSTITGFGAAGNLQCATAQCTQALPSSEDTSPLPSPSLHPSATYGTPTDPPLHNPGPPPAPRPAATPLPSCLARRPAPRRPLPPPPPVCRSTAWWAWPRPSRGTWRSCCTAWARCRHWRRCARRSAHQRWVCIYDGRMGVCIRGKTWGRCRPWRRCARRSAHRRWVSVY